MNTFYQGTIEFYQELLKLFDPRYEEETEE